MGPRDDDAAAVRTDRGWSIDVLSYGPGSQKGCRVAGSQLLQRISAQIAQLMRLAAPPGQRIIIIIEVKSQC